jgi:hypothetical protein
VPGRITEVDKRLACALGGDQLLQLARAERRSRHGSAYLDCERYNAAVRELAPGDEFAGHRIEAVIGAGGMGVVYRALHLELERPVALKLIAPGRAVDEAWRARFRRESRLAASLDHPAILTVYDSGEHDGLLYVTMRLVEGGDLGRRLAAEGPLGAEDAVGLVEQLASALDAAHTRGLVHRDVKPANVLLEPPRAFLADFGLAREIHDSAGPTATGQWVGSIDYAAPEQVSEGLADPRSDVYALAGVLYAAVSGRPPFPRGDPAAVMWAHVHEPPPVLEPDALRSLGDVVAKGMAKDGDERFQSAGELAAAARAALGQPRTVTSEDGAASPARGSEAAGSRPRRRFARWIAVCLAAAIAAAVALVLVLRDGDGGALDAPVTVDRIKLPGEPVDVAVADGTPWVALTDRDDTTGAVVAIENGRAAKPVRLPAPPVALAADDGALWVLLADGLLHWKLQRFDPKTRWPVGVRIDLGTAPHGARIAVTPGAVWISDPDDDTLLRVDPATSRLQRTLRIPAGVDGPLAVGEGAVWVLSGDPRLAVTPVDPDSGAVGRPIRVGDSATVPEGLAVAGGSVWVGDPDTGALRRIAGQRRQPVPRSVRLEARVGAMVFGDGALWALAGNGELVRRIDPDTGRLRGRPMQVDVASDARLALGADAAWVTDAQRVSMLRLRY